MKFEIKEGKILVNEKEFNLVIVILGVVSILTGVVSAVSFIYLGITNYEEALRQLSVGGVILCSAGQVCAWILVFYFYYHCKMGTDPDKEKEYKVKNNSLMEKKEG